MKNDNDKIPRFTVPERINHWSVAITFILLALSGLVFFHPFFQPLSQLFGGGTWTRIIHPFLGVAMIFSFGGMFLRFRKLCVITETDKEWLRRAKEMMNGDTHNMPEAGKLNGGQKMMFWMLSGCMVLLVLSGIIMWRAYFSFLFPAWMIRFASVVHAATGIGMIALIVGHVYAAIWTKESINAMIYGKVRRAWAKHHHPAWFRQMTGEDK
jgi:formate dehydrogenase subunit gamma